MTSHAHATGRSIPERLSQSQVLHPLSALVFVWAVVVCVAATVAQPPVMIWTKALRMGPYIPWDMILPAFAWLGLLGLAARGVGGWLLQRFGRLDLTPAEEWVFSLGVGIGGLAYATLAVGVAGGLYRWPARLVVLGLAAWGLAVVRRGGSPEPPAGGTGIPPLPRLPMALALLAWGVNLLGALGPETFYDSLLYHVSVPQLYINEHGMVRTSNNLYSMLPFTQEMLYTLALLLQGDTLAKLVSWAFGVGLTAATALLGLRLGHPWAGAWASALVATTPAVLFNGRISGTECALSFWCLLTLWVVIRFRETHARPWLLLAGVFGGLAAGTKYLGVLACLVLGIMIHLDTRRFREGLVFASMAALVFLPWPVRTAVLSGGNPVHPYFTTVLDPGALPPDGFAQWIDETRRSDIVRTVWDRVLHPWVLTMKEELSPNHLGPWVLAVAPLAVAALRQRLQAAGVLAMFAVGYWVCWAPATMSQRFLLPALPPLGLAAMMMVARAVGGGRQAAVTLATAVALMGINRAATGMGFEATWLVTTGQDTRDNFLSRPHGMYDAPSYGAILWINRFTPPPARVLLLGETRGAYLERPFLAGTTFDWPPAVGFVGGAAEADEVYRRMRAAGITHLLVNLPFGMKHGHLGRWRQLDQDAPVFEAFFRKHAAQRFWMPQGIGVFELVDVAPRDQGRPDLAAAVAWGPRLRPVR